MKFNPLTQTLYTNDGQRIKKIHCPYPSLKWSELSTIEGKMDKVCSLCESRIVETKEYSDEALAQTLARSTRYLPQDRFKSRKHKDRTS